MNINNMCKDDLRNLDDKIRQFEKLCDNACEVALAKKDYKNLDRLENLLKELIKFDSVVISRIHSI